MSLRKVTKTRGSFPNNDAIFKILYLALKNASKKWTMPIQNWKEAMNHFAILFEDRMVQDGWQNTIYTVEWTPPKVVFDTTAIP